jgi:hypothetical protein
MTEQDNTTTVQRLYAAFGAQDLDAVLTLLDDDVQWRHPRPRDIPWGGARSGRDGVCGFFQSLASHLEVDHFVPQHWVAREDQVIVFGRERMRTREAQHVYEVDWVHAFTLRDAKIVAFEEYTDTATIIEALTANGTGEKP